MFAPTNKTHSTCTFTVPKVTIDFEGVNVSLLSNAGAIFLLGTAQQRDRDHVPTVGMLIDELVQVIVVRVALRLHLTRTCHMAVNINEHHART